MLDHRFGESDPYTLGVEEEYQLLDGESFDLVQHIETVLAAIQGHELEPRINPELMQSVLEIATPVCRTPADVMRELSKLRGYVCGVAGDKGMRVGSAGTHPFSLFERQRITAKDRYRAARRSAAVHRAARAHLRDARPRRRRRSREGDQGRERAAPPARAAARAVGELAVLAGRADGPDVEPADGVRVVPALGPPPRFRDYADYAEVVGQLERTGCIADYTHIWWDIRLHPRLGTIEIRICDAVTRVEDAVAIAAYCQALVKQLSERYDAGEEIPSYHRILTTENKWLAARYGLEAPVMDLATGRRNRVPIAQLVRRTLREIEPHARELGSERELEGIREHPRPRQQRRPPAADLQREPRHRRGRRQIADTAEKLPLPRSDTLERVRPKHRPSSGLRMTYPGSGRAGPPTCSSRSSPAGPQAAGPRLPPRRRAAPQTTSPHRARVGRCTPPCTPVSSAWTNAGPSALRTA